MKIFILLILALMVTSCDQYKVYTIKKGAHYSFYGAKPLPLKMQKMNFTAMFDDSAIYTNIDPLNQADQNKLYGFTDCSNTIHENSARFTWRWYNDQLEILAYTYVNGERISQFVGVAELNQSYDYSIEIDGNQYIFTFNDIEVVMDRGCSNLSAIKTRSYPYFGGDETAPHDITIHIAENLSKKQKKLLKKYIATKK